MDRPASALSSSFLVAMPQLDDPNFHRSVVLLVQHESDGSFGVVLNRPADLTVVEVLENVGIAWPGGALGSVGWGGPVQPDLAWVLFAGDPPAETGSPEVTALSDGIYLTGSREMLRRIAAQPPADLRLLLGYAGWGAGQLESELAQGAWLLAPLRREIVFSATVDTMWDRVVRGLGIDPTALVPTHGVH